jgi:hypothetical protein
MDGDIVTTCEQVCPSRAIVRSDLGTRLPYLARVGNRNSELRVSPPTDARIARRLLSSTT